MIWRYLAPRLRRNEDRKAILFSLFLIAVVCLLSYSNTFHVPLQFDDPYNIGEKPYVRDISWFFGPARNDADSSFLMRPVAYFTLAVNYSLHGEDVAGYHIVNLLIHILNGFLVYFLVLLTFKTPYFARASEGRPTPAPLPGGDEEGLRRSDRQGFIALFAALLFVSHPIQTQAVTYIVQRLASLATLFFLLSLVAYIKWRLGRTGDSSQQTVDRKQDSPHASRFTWFFYAASLISAVLAMKTKETAFTLPLVICLYESMFFKGPAKKRILYLLPLLLTLLIIPLGLMGMAKPVGEVIGDVGESMRVQTNISRWEYLFTEFRVIVTYIRLLFFPVNQNLDYDYPVYRSFFDPNVILSFLFLLSIFGLGVYLVCKTRVSHPVKVTPPSAPPLKRRGGRGSYDPARSDRPGNGAVIAPATDSSPLPPYTSRLAAFGIFWFFITLSVESSVIPIADVIFEHRLYLPSVGFFIAVTAGGVMMWQDRHARSAVMALGIIILIFSGTTYARNRIWGSDTALWEDTVKKSRAKARPYNGLGLAYMEKGRVDEALEDFMKAVSLNPSYSVAHNSLGAALYRKKDFGRAAEEFSMAIALSPKNVVFLNNRGLAYAAMGETDKAISDYLAAIALDSSYDDPHHNLGAVYHGKGLYDRAVEEYTKAINLETDNAVYYNNRALSYTALLAFDKAIADYARAIDLDPFFADAYKGRGVAFGELGRLDEAHEDLNRAVSLDPSKASSYINRAVVHERMKDIASALSDFQSACDLGDERGCGGVEYLRKKYQSGK